MSIKLPQIIQRKTNQDSPQTSPKESSPPLKDLENHHEEQYPDHDFQQFEEAEIIESNEPVETVTVLKGQSSSEEGTLNVEVKEQTDTPKKQHELQQLQQILEDRLKTVNEYQLSIADKKKEIKSIGEKVDKDLNKSLLRATRQQTVNIRDIFSGTPTKSSNEKINNFNQELNKIRFTIKQVKQDISKLQQSLTDPVLIMNEERGIEARSKIRSAEQDIKTIQHEKSLLEQEISRGGKEFNQEEEKQRAKEFQKKSQELSELNCIQREQKIKLYRLEKEDILLMEKSKFFQERQGLIGSKKQVKPPPTDKQKLERQIKELIIQINGTVEERNRTENQKKQQAKSLTAQISSLETKNWELFNRLRELDAFLLQHYEKKSRRKDLKPLQKTVDVMEKSSSGKVDYQTVNEDYLYKSKVSENDKNLKVEDDKNFKEVLVEKKKNYEFGSKEVSEDDINLSDQFLGSKLIISKLILICDEQHIYSIQAHYKNTFGNDIVGLMMGCRRLPEKTETLKLNLNNNQLINFVHSGSKETKTLSFLHFVTSQGKQLKWGFLEELIKSEQKHIKQYQSCYLKGKMVKVMLEDEEKMGAQLAGFTLATTYLAPK